MMDRKQNNRHQRRQQSGNRNNNRNNNTNNKNRDSSQDRFRFNRNAGQQQPARFQQPAHNQAATTDAWQQVDPADPGPAPPGSWDQPEPVVAQEASSEQQHQQQANRRTFAQSDLDVEADEHCGETHRSLMQAIEASHKMPLSEHVLYSSYESYDNIMVEQRKTLEDMLGKLSVCVDFSNASQAQATNLPASRIDFAQIDGLRDKYDIINDLRETMFDRIGQNLDDAAGWTSRNAQLIEATLQAASQNRLSNQQAPTNAPEKQLTSSSSSPSLTGPVDSGNSSPTSTRSQMQEPTQKVHRPMRPPAKYLNNPVINNVQSSSQQTRSQYGNYLGKQPFGSGSQRFAMLENKNIPRPQIKFKDKINNNQGPFEPLIKVKPNALAPLELVLERDEHGNEFYSHPYEYEIQAFSVPTELTMYRDPIEPPDPETTPIIWIDTIEQLEEMCRLIEGVTEFAVDVEHHSYRTFQGITCLLQISTRTHDFVIDAIKLRSELHRLNQSFTDPKIVKVFHGADCDILWLQRDFGVYVVNLFDTSRAAKLMKFAHLSLAFLLKHYCNVEPDKSYQLADWRERPLPVPMIQYAREDTHFLLYVFDRLRNDLLKKGSCQGPELVKSVYERGKEICLKRYEKPPFSETSHLAVLRKSRSTFNAKQMYAFKEMYAWRDSISRDLDESVGYVLPNNLMIRIAEYLPREPQGITALCNPIPPTVKKYLSDIHSIIMKAIEVPLDETSKVIGNPLNVNPSLRSIDLDSINHKHDIAHAAGINEASVPTLLDKMQLLSCTNERTITLSSRDREHINSNRNMKQEPSVLYNFLDSGSWKNRHNNATSVHRKQFVNSYQ